MGCNPSSSRSHSARTSVRRGHRRELLLACRLSGTRRRLGLIFFTLYGPFLVWVTRRNIERWDTAHPN
jgi:hypothetical protein